MTILVFENAGTDRCSSASWASPSFCSTTKVISFQFSVSVSVLQSINDHSDRKSINFQAAHTRSLSQKYTWKSRLLVHLVRRRWFSCKKMTILHLQIPWKVGVFMESLALTSFFAFVCSRFASCPTLACSLWAVYEQFMSSLWAIYEQFMSSLWAVYEQFMSSLWAIDEQLMSSLWAVYEQFMSKWWAVYEQFMSSLQLHFRHHGCDHRQFIGR